MNFIRVTIVSLDKKSLKEIASLLFDKLNALATTVKYLQWYLCCQDAIESKLYKPKTPRPKRKPSENICRTQFHNKAIP